MYKSVGYSTLKDLAPVAMVADLPLLLVVNPDLPVKSVADLVAYAKANPEKLAHPSSGNGTLSHLGMEVFKQRLEQEYNLSVIATAPSVLYQIKMAVLILRNCFLVITGSR